MAKYTDIDKLLEQLESSDMLKKLIQTIKRYWEGDSEQGSKSSQKVEDQLQKITEKKEIVEKIVYQDKIIEVPVEKIIEKKIEITPAWAFDLQNQKEYIEALAQFPELQSIFNLDQQTEASKILAFISASSQWQNIVRIWDKLAEQCKSSQHEIEAGKLSILENAIYLYNLTLSSSKAELRTPNLNTAYDYNIHNQITGSGSQIKSTLLSGLYNASGEKVKSALVITV